MVAIQEVVKLAAEEYLNLEEINSVKHEYINGEVYKMAGANSAHVTISLNIASLLKNHLRGSDCRVYIADMKVRIDSLNLFYYPDVIVTCSQDDRALDYYKKYPQIIIEVLSESTESFDRGDKFADYRLIESLKEYVLISQTKKRVDLFTKQDNNLWQLTSFSEGENLVLNSINFTGAVSSLYEDI
ncbi:Uma2 family endonuclease [Geminocystis sp. GBBB08]|uniref:Uma2 family endonuclease n=1 Tax=Geminocystis sp. GBBB08 TaxID=2604140 RepID=UPI0027E31C87|nr:Uma2 family endonuclease [Geminocystis sp. GBBB08]MBL1208663.1 Uma2 family endonuclease [Geminocystis sp. GBBB08]